MIDLFKEANKIISFKKILPFFIVLGLFALFMFAITIINMKRPNKEYYNTEIIGKVVEIKKYPKDFYFLIDNNWFIIKDDFIDYIAKGDSIIKNRNSYITIIKSEDGVVKFKDETKTVIVKAVPPN